jgi:RimJ/RimL family protein N-acetyltransferase
MAQNSKVVRDNIAVRLATLEDSDLVWRWRNDMTTRKVSKNSAEIPWNDHQNWFRDSLNDPHTTNMIAELSDIAQPIGYVRFDNCVATQTANISINVGPESRGKGFAVPLLLKCIRNYQRTGFATIVAEVKPANIKSIKAFERVGFVHTENRNEILKMTFSTNGNRI